MKNGGITKPGKTAMNRPQTEPRRVACAGRIEAWHDTGDATRRRGAVPLGSAAMPRPV